MMPRAVSPALAEARAAGLSDARLTFLVACATGVDRIPVSTGETREET